MLNCALHLYYIEKMLNWLQQEYLHTTFISIQQIFGDMGIVKKSA